MRKEDNNMIPITGELYENLMKSAVVSMIDGKEAVENTKSNINEYIKHLKKSKEFLKDLRLKKEEIKKKMKKVKKEITIYKRVLRDEKWDLKRRTEELNITSNSIKTLNKKYILDDYIEDSYNNQKVIK